MAIKITTADIAKEIERRKYNQIESIFPDKGKYRRELYHQHMKFFKAGSEFRERIFIAANRCLTPWVFLPNNLPILLALTDSDFGVQAWDGENQCNAQASGGFLKRIDQAFRVVMEDNQFFDCTYEHRLLSCDGYVSLKQLMLQSSGLRSTQTIEDYQANCVEDGYLCGQPPLDFLSSVLRLTREQVDALAHNQIFWHKDEVERIHPHTHALLNGGRLSNRDDLNRLWGLFALFAVGAYSKPFVSLSSRIEEFLIFLAELSQTLSSSEPLDNQASLLHDYASCLSVESKLEQLVEIFPEFQQLLSVVYPQQITPLSLIDNSHISIFYPLKHPRLVGGKRIKAVVPIGLQPIIDFTVPKYNNYLLADVFHHNTGKSVAGGYEVACHLTGLYPDWWEGKRFDRPIVCWCAGDTGKTTRDIIQLKLLGMPGSFGTGLIPKDKIVRTLAKQGISDGIEMIHVKHVSGGNSLCVLKSYDQRREGFQGTEVHVIWPDEEPPQDIYIEMLLRTMTTNGIVLTTFTPLMGLSDVVLSFCPGGELAEGTVKENATKHVTVCDWDSVPHLSQKEKDDMYAAIPPFQRDARSKGIPQLGSGAIYQVPESDIVVEDREIPKNWKRCYGMDVGWNRTAAAWFATDPETHIAYIYHTYYRGHAEPAIHAQGIKAPGDWIPGAIDPAARGRGQADGRSLAEMYNDLGLHLTYANNAVESGIYEVWELLSSGRLKVFKSCKDWLAEYRVYRRDEKGKIVKENDHLMDATRYGVMTGLSIAGVKPVINENNQFFGAQNLTTGWMG